MNGYTFNPGNSEQKLIDLINDSNITSNDFAGSTLITLQSTSDFTLEGATVFANTLYPIFSTANAANLLINGAADIHVIIQ